MTDDRAEIIVQIIHREHDLVPIAWCRKRAEEFVKLADRAGCDPLEFDWMDAEREVLDWQINES